MRIQVNWELMLSVPVTIEVEVPDEDVEEVAENGGLADACSTTVIRLGTPGCPTPDEVGGLMSDKSWGYFADEVRVKLAEKLADAKGGE